MPSGTGQLAHTAVALQPAPNRDVDGHNSPFAHCCWRIVHPRVPPRELSAAYSPGVSEPSPWPDTPVTGTVMLSFDGRVLEVFGFTDAARFHVWERPRIEIGGGRRFRRFTIVTRGGRRHPVLYEEKYLSGLRSLAAHLAETDGSDSAGR